MCVTVDIEHTAPLQVHPIARGPITNHCLRFLTILASSPHLIIKDLFVLNTSAKSKQRHK